MFGFLCLVVVIAAAFNTQLSGIHRVGVIAAVVFLIVSHATYGRWSQIRSDFQAVVYLLGNLVAVTISIAIWDVSSILLFGIYWIGFAYLYTGYAVIYAMILTAATQISFGNADIFTDFDLGSIAGLGMLITITVLSGMMAKYIESFHRETERSRNLLRELRQAQESLVQRERDESAERERIRLAGEIHDTIAQQLTSIITNLRAADELHEMHPDMADHHRSLALTAAQQGLKESREMLHTMQPAIASGRSVSLIMKEIITQNPSPPCSFQNEGVERSISRVQETILVRALQEALRNIRKHAQATHAAATLSWLEDEVLLDISDNGVGFDPDQPRTGDEGFHMGLITMRARVESSGGTMVVDSSPGEGTSLTISFPMESES